MGVLGPGGQSHQSISCPRFIHSCPLAMPSLPRGLPHWMSYA